MPEACLRHDTIGALALLPGSRELILQRFQEIGERRAVLGLNLDLDRHSRHEACSAEVCDVGVVDFHAGDEECASRARVA